MTLDFPHPPKENCIYCNGLGIRRVKNGHSVVNCVCRFFDHDCSDTMGNLIGNAAKKALKEMQDEY